MHQEPDIHARSETDPPGQPSRRTVLESAVAGFALAAAGLFATGSRDEAAARQVSAEGKSGRKKRRAKRRRKNNENPGAPGSGGDKRTNVRLIVENLTSNPLYFKGWIVTDDRRCPTRDLQTIAPNTAPTFAPGDNHAFGLIFDPDDLQYTFGGADQDPDDGFPYVEIHHGGTLTTDRCLVDATPDVLHREMGVGMSFEKTVHKFRFVVKREGDISNEHVFRFQIYTAP